MSSSKYQLRRKPGPLTNIPDIIALISAINYNYPLEKFLTVL